MNGQGGGGVNPEVGCGRWRLFHPWRRDCDLPRVDGTWLLHRWLMTLDAEFLLPGI